MTPKIQIVRDVLERAKDAGDAMVIAACRRLINAYYLGWKKHSRAEDRALVFGIAEE